MEVKQLTALEWDSYYKLINQFRPANKELAQQLEKERFECGIKTFIMMDGEDVVATASVFKEPKVIHSIDKVEYVLHVEDIVVDKERRGKGLGTKMVDYCREYGKSQGCYKTILDCSENIAQFYNKCNMSKFGVAMEYRYE